MIAIRVFLGLIFFCFLLNNVKAQKYTISGYVVDENSGEAVINTNVYDLRTKQGTITNDYGFYSLTLVSDTVELSVSFVGYQSYSYLFFLNSDIELNIQLNPSILLPEVTVTDKKSDEMVKTTQMSMIEMPMQHVKSLPVLLGESDVFKTLQLMPGIQSGSEGTSGLYVRGGGPDQNLILLDGVPVYNASHLFGFFSVFNPDAISNVKLIKGGFPAHYGGRLSSVIDIRMKEGNMKEFHGEGGIGIISANLTLEGPIIKDKTSFIVSGRRTYIDAIAAPIIMFYNKRKDNSDKIRAGYYFYDANIKVNHKFSDKDRLYLSFYTGRDKAYFRTKDRYRDGETQNENIMDAGLYWRNITTSLRWNHVFSNKLFFNATAVYSNYIFDINYGSSAHVDEQMNSEFKYRYFSGIENIGGTFDFDYNPFPKHFIKFGGSYLYHVFKPGVFTYRINEEGDETNQKFGNNNIYANEFYVYIEDSWDLSAFMKLNYGVHFSGFTVGKTFYSSPQPRISLRFLLNDKMSLKVAYSTMNQYIHLLTNSTIGLPTDLWLPSTDNIIPEKSRQVALGFAYNINNNFDLSIEGFYKSMDNLIEYKEGASFFNISQNWESKVESGRGYSYGGEFLIRKNYGKFTGWVGYTLSWSWRRFDELNFGERFPYKYDRRHDLSIVMQYRLNEKVDFGVTWVFSSGNAASLPVAMYMDAQIIDNTSWGYGEDLGYYKNRNSFRMPSYQRLDISANFHKKKKWGERTWSFGLYNAYNRQNPFFVYVGYKDEYDNGSSSPDSKKVLKQISLFPIIPSVKYSFKF